MLGGLIPNLTYLDINLQTNFKLQLSNQVVTKFLPLNFLSAL